jgi:Dockerin type I domain/Bacterial Ig-like domain (group 2)
MNKQFLFTALSTIGTLLCGQSGIAQSSASLSITSPAPNTQYKEGQTVTVQVTPSPRNASFANVGLETLLPALSSSQTAPPAQVFTFTLLVPTGAVGPLSISAVGFPTGGLAPVSSAPILINVLPSQDVTGLKCQTSTVGMRFVGDARRLAFMGTFADGSKSPISGGYIGMMSFSSSAPTVVSIDSTGLAKALAPGTVTVTAKITNASGSVKTGSCQVSVPTSIPGDLDGNGAVDLDDVAILQGYLNRIASGTNDARDLNHDGKIDALDLRVLTTLCTRSRCAVQ